MVSDTKNKRGRPKLPSTIAAESVWPEKETRTAQNISYAGNLILLLGQKPGDFFVTSRGSLRRQGIAEQIGRMLESDLITTDQARELAEQCIDDYQNGETVKDIVKHLTYFRQLLQEAAKQEGITCR